MIRRFFAASFLILLFSEPQAAWGFVDIYGNSSLFYNQAMPSGCMGQSYLPMGSASTLGSYYDPMVNCVPRYASEPWLYYGAPDGRYYGEYPWPPRDPNWPVDGNAPSYYSSRRYDRDDVSTSTSSYSYSYHSSAAARTEGSDPSAWDDAVNGKKTKSVTVTTGAPAKAVAVSVGADSAKEKPSGKTPSNPSHTADQTSATGQAPKGADSAASIPPLVIEPVAPGDSSIIILPTGLEGLPEGLQALPARAAEANAQPAADAPPPLVLDPSRSAPATPKPDSKPAEPPKTQPAKTQPAAKPPPSVVPPPTNADVGGNKPEPPLTSTGQLNLPAPEQPKAVLRIRSSESASPSETSPRAATEPSPAKETAPKEEGMSPEDRDEIRPREQMEAVGGPEICKDCNNTTTRIPLDGIEPLAETLSEVSPAVLGARTILAVLYQNCDALKVKIDGDFKMRGSIQPEDGVATESHDPNRYFPSLPDAIASNPYLKNSYDGKTCRDMRKTPPVFHVGGKAMISRDSKHLTVNVFNFKNNPSRGTLNTMDCSGFISASMAAAGLKITKGAEPYSSYQTSTVALLGITGKSANACVKPAMLTADQSLKAGDIMVYKDPVSKDIYGHTFMIEKVGKDPFAVSKFHSAADCEDRSKYEPANFDFSIIQSSALFGRMAASHAHVRDVMVSNPNLAGWLQDMARRACLAKFSGPKEAEVRLSIPTGKKRTIHKTMAVLRHVGPSVKECMEPKPVKVTGDACLEGCKEIGK